MVVEAGKKVGLQIKQEDAQTIAKDIQAKYKREPRTLTMEEAEEMFNFPPVARHVAKYVEEKALK